MQGRPDDRRTLLTVMKHNCTPSDSRLAALRRSAHAATGQRRGERRRPGRSPREACPPPDSGFAPRSTGRRSWPPRRRARSPERRAPHRSASPGTRCQDSSPTRASASRRRVERTTGADSAVSAWRTSTWRSWAMRSISATATSAMTSRVACVRVADVDREDRLTGDDVGGVRFVEHHADRADGDPGLRIGSEILHSGDGPRRGRQRISPKSAWASRRHGRPGPST